MTEYKPAHPKPGKPQKSAKIKNKAARLHDIKKPDDAYCRFCDEQDDGTGYWHHCEIPYLKLKYGSGTARKIDDNLTAFGHHKCGTEMSKQPVSGQHFTNAVIRFNGIVDYKFILEWELKWLMAIIESHLV